MVAFQPDEHLVCAFYTILIGSIVIALSSFDEIKSKNAILDSILANYF